LPSPLLIRILGGGRGPTRPEPTKKRDGWDRLDVLGKLAQGFLAIVVSGIAAFFSFQASRAVNEHNQREEVLNRIDLQNKALTYLAETDPVRKTVGKIEIAQYGSDALPLLRVLLKSADGAVRVAGLDIAENLCLNSAQTSKASGRGAPNNAAEPARLKVAVTAIVAEALADDQFEITVDVRNSLTRLCARLEPDDVRKITKTLVTRFEPYSLGSGPYIESLKRALELFRTQPGCCSEILLRLLKQPALKMEVWEIALDALNSQIAKGGVSLQDLQTWRSKLTAPEYGHLGHYVDNTLGNLDAAILKAGGSVR
jgi:hypothetical protein